MTEENEAQNPPTESEVAPEADPQPEAQASPPEAEAQAQANPQPEWEYRKNFKIVDKMKNIVNLTIDVTRAEQARLRRQIEKLTYGS